MPENFTPQKHVRCLNEICAKIQILIIPVFCFVFLTAIQKKSKGSKWKQRLWSGHVGGYLQCYQVSCCLYVCMSLSICAKWGIVSQLSHIFVQWNISIILNKWNLIILNKIIKILKFYISAVKYQIPILFVIYTFANLWESFGWN